MIRKAKQKDIKSILKLLGQVNWVHHQGRPDLFEKTTKYNEQELCRILDSADHTIFVATDEQDRVQGYAFCLFHTKHFI